MNLMEYSCSVCTSMHAIDVRVMSTQLTKLSNVIVADCRKGFLNIISIDGF